MWKSVCITALIVAVQAYPNYRGLLPNGNKVPDPCSSGIWNGVGHYNISGSGTLNPFGVDFAASGHQWTKPLCLKNSDGDGKSNGEELGDPQCHFTPVNNAHLVAPMGHPGICEPVGGDNCAAQTFTCPSS